ncbi:MAG: alpha-L-fucosidase [Cyclobacteriaceae bacterium]|nr:MAG: alpha-L-fucosidase [Cyclobacteriaceae bacterium]
MKLSLKQNFIAYWIIIFLFIGCADKQAKNESEMPNSKHLTTSPDQPKRPENFQPFRYKYSIVELNKRFTEDILKRGSEELKKLSEVNAKGPYKPTIESLGSHPMPEWFQDAKLGIFLDWGPWSAAGYAPKKGAEASTGGSYPDWYEFLMDYLYKEYHDEVFGADFRRDDLLPMLTGSNFDAEEYVQLTIDAGARYLVPFSKHHGGWTMWESSYTKRNAVEMGPGRDIYKELAEASKKNNIKLGFYFSVSEWEYPVIVEQPVTQWAPVKNIAIFQDELGQIPRGKPLTTYFPAVHDRMISGKIPVRDYFADYMMPSFKEAIDKFDPDLVWYDGGWGSPVSVSRAAELSAYFYNQANNRKEVVINNRAGSTMTDEELSQFMEYMKSGEQEKAMQLYLNSARLGDYGTPEYTIGEVDITKKWEVCRSISPAFGYNWQDDEESSQSSEDLIKMFIKIVAENGNLLLVINPDGSGKLSEIQKNRLKELGLWLKINGEGIYSTRPWIRQQDGDLFFTSSKEGKYVYAHLTSWPGEKLTINGITPSSDSKITMLGFDDSLVWNQSEAGVVITLPETLQVESNRPTKYAWVIKVQIK